MDEEGFFERIFQEQYARQEARKILEVDENADQETLKKAYRRACLKYHPDRNPDDQEAHEKFLLVQCAFELLTKNTICPMLLEKMKSQAMNFEKGKQYNIENPWEYFLWWREQFFDDF